MEIINTNTAPAAIGPYSQAIKIKAGNLLFCSGQLGINPMTGIIEGDVVAQAKQALENLKAIAAAAGTSLEQAVKTTIFLTDMNDFPKVNEVYATYFPHNNPARSTIAVSALPKQGLVEIEAVILCP